MVKFKYFFVALMVLLHVMARGQALFPFEENGKWGYIGENGNILVPATFQAAGAFSDGMAIVIKDDKLGILNEKGEQISTPQLESIAPFYEGLAAVEIENKWGFINKKGEFIIEPQYFQVGFYSNGLCRVKQTPSLFDKWGYIDVKGNMVINPKFESASDFSETLALASEDGIHFGYINKTGEFQIKPIYKYHSKTRINGVDNFPIGNFAEGLATVTFGLKMGFINTNGKLVIDTLYDEANSFSGGLASVKSNGKCGYIDKSNKIIIPLQYTNALNFSEGLAAVCSNKQFGFIDKTGQIMIPFSLPENKPNTGSLRFKNGVVLVFFAPQRWGYLNWKGVIIWKTEK